MPSKLYVLLRLLGISIEVSDLQYPKACTPKYSSDFDNVTEEREVQLENAYPPTHVTLLGITMLSSEVQPANAEPSISSTLSIKIPVHAISSRFSTENT